jgi:hypothetical protein
MTKARALPSGPWFEQALHDICNHSVGLGADGGGTVVEWDLLVGFGEDARWDRTIACEFPFVVVVGVVAAPTATVVVNTLVA